MKPYQIASESESGVAKPKNDVRNLSNRQHINNTYDLGDWRRVNKFPLKLAVTTRAQAAAEAKAKENAARDANNEDNIINNAVSDAEPDTEQIIKDK